MSFDSRYDSRFEKVIRPAIEFEKIGGLKLSAFRVDISKTGDSILTEIANGIAHSRIVIADVSTIDEGKFSEKPVRNGNVMYEAGLALACRQPSEVLIIRDDDKSCLFDVSTIPHMRIDFDDHENAVASLRNAIADRISETKFSNDS